MSTFFREGHVDHDASMLVWNDDAVVPTCSETGWEAGYICNECHKRFADVDGHVEMSPVAALGTTYGAACIYNDDSKAIIDGMSSEFIDREADYREITGDVTINRHFVAKRYSTIVQPFETRTGDVPGFSFYSFKKVEKVNGVWKNVVFGYVDEKQDGDKVIEANTPYIVVADNDMDALVVKNGVVLDLRTPEPETLFGEEDSDWQFVGTYNYRQWDSDHNVKEIGTTYGFAGAEGDNTEASIGTFNTRTGEFRSADNRWFDLNGRYLGNKKPTIKGTYYNNGKKVIVK